MTDTQPNDFDPRHGEKSAWITDLSFRKERWKNQSALVSKDGRRRRPYREGDEFDPALWELVPDGWDHGRCAICFDYICEHEEHGFPDSYLNDSGAWVCPPCYELYFRERVEAWIQAGRPALPAAEGEIEAHEA